MDNTSANIAPKAKIRARQRAENWTREEKNLFLEIMRDSAPIVENKQTDTDSNKRKYLEWLQVQSRFTELTGKWRDVFQLKGFWRRLKIQAKKNKKSLWMTCGGNPPSPSEDDPLEINPFDSDGIFENVQIDKNENNKTEINKIKQSQKKNYKKPCQTESMELRNFSRKLLVEEHKLKMKYQKLELNHQQIRHKMEIDILILEKEKKELEIRLLKKSLL